MRSAQQLRYETCFHESGHTAAAHLLGRTVHEVTIVPDFETAGRTDLELSDDRWSALDDIVIMLAGEAAFRMAVASDFARRAPRAGVEVTTVGPAELPSQVLNAPSQTRDTYIGWFDRKGCRGDVGHAEDLAHSITSSTLEAETLLSWLRVRTTELTKRPDFAAIVEAVAEALLTHDTLNGEQVVMVIDWAKADLAENGARTFEELVSSLMKEETP